MVHLGETLFRLATYALAGRVRRHQLRMAAFQHTQLAHPGVVLRVGNLRRIQHVILIFVVAELIAQLVDSFGVVLLNRAGLGSSFRHSVHYRNLEADGLPAVHEHRRKSAALAAEALKPVYGTCYPFPHWSMPRPNRV